MFLRLFLTLTVMLFFSYTGAQAKDLQTVEGTYAKAPIQERINSIGFKILNANKLDKHVIFVYSTDKKEKIDSSIIKREVTVYDEDLKHASLDDELAAFISRKISFSMKSFDGGFGGLMGSAHVLLAPKSYELIADKRAVEYMVKAGYNPIGLMTYIIKAYPQAKQDKISNHNLTSKRLMYIYETIYTKYPYFLVNNSYANNAYYQNFLLNSVQNRKKLEEKIKNKDTRKIKYD